MIRDISGNIVPVGKTARRLEECFLYNYSPSWITQSGDVGYAHTMSYPHESHGYIMYETDSATNSEMTVNVLPDGVNMETCEEISLTIESLYFNSINGNVKFCLCNDAMTKGFYLEVQQANAAKLVFLSDLNGATEEEIAYDILDSGEYKRRRNITLKLRKDKTVILLEGDDVIYEKQISSDNMVSYDILKPRIEVVNLITSTTASYKCYMSKIALEIQHN